MSPTTVLTDFGNRNASNGWLTSVNGLTWTPVGGVASEYSVVSGVGRINMTSVNVFRSLSTNAPLYADYQLRVDLTSNIAVPTGASEQYVFDFRIRNSGNDFYRVNIYRTTANTVTVELALTVGGSGAVMVAAVTIPGVTATSPISARMDLSGQWLRARVWATGTTEPTAWTVATPNNQVAGTGSFRMGALLDPGNTNTLPVLASFLNLTVTTGSTPLGFVYPVDGDLLCGTGLPVVTAVEQLAESVQAFLTSSGLDALAAESAQGVPSSQVLKSDLVLTVSNIPWSGPVDTTVFDKNTPTDFTVFPNGVILGQGVWWVLAEGITAQNSLVTMGDIGSDGNARITYPVTVNANIANQESLGGGSQDLKLFRTLPNRSVPITVSATGNIAGSNPLVTVSALTSVQVSETVT